MKKSKIRIALFAEVLKENLDGVTNTLYNILERIPKDRFELVLITPYPPSDHIKLPFPIIVIPKIPFPFHKKYPLALPQFHPTLESELDDFDPDLIHLTTPFTLGQYALSYGKKRDIPVLSTYHTHFVSYIEYYLKNAAGLTQLVNWGGWKYMKWFYNQCHKTFVPTSSIVEELLQAGIEANKLTVWGRGVNTTLFNPEKRDEEYIENLCGKNTNRILFVSRLVWEKELETLVEIYKRFQIARPDIKMVITGDGPGKERMETEMPEAIFTGKLLKDDLARMYASCDVFVFPSITETFGNVVLESMASGLVPVVAAKGGPKGIVDDGVNGYHAIPRDINDFCEKITFLVDHPDIRLGMREKGIKYAKTQKWDALCEDMFETYEEVFSETPDAGIQINYNDPTKFPQNLWDAVTFATVNRGF